MVGRHMAARVPVANPAARDWLREEVRAHPSSDFTADERNAARGHGQAGTPTPHDSLYYPSQSAIIQRRARVKLDREDGGAVTDDERKHAFERLKRLEKRPIKRAAASDESDGPSSVSVAQPPTPKTSRQSVCPRRVI